jgi:cytochrome c biogenesis protein CcdA
MNIALITTLTTIALVDSINPSAIVMTLVLLSSGKNKVLKSLVYVTGIFVTYFAIGSVLLLAYNLFGSSFKFDFNPLTNFIIKPPLWSYYLQLILGCWIVVYAVKYFSKKSNNDSIEPSKSQPKSLLAVFVLGMTITLVEASSALPYFGGISTIFVANLGLLNSLIFLTIYNLVFILPPLAIILIYCFNSNHFERIISRIKCLLQKYSYSVLKYGMIVIGAGLCADSLMNTF